MILKNCIFKIKILFFILFLLLFTSFVYRSPIYCKISDCIVRSYVKEFAIPRRLMLYSKGGAMMHDVKEVCLRFLSHDALNVEEARILYVEMMEEILFRYNRHEKIRPHLHNYPFEISNIKLSLAFEDFQNNITGDGHVALISIARNPIIYYAAYDPIKEEFYTLHEESYEEARKILEKNEK